MSTEVIPPVTIQKPSKNRHERRRLASLRRKAIKKLQKKVNERFKNPLKVVTPDVDRPEEQTDSSES